MLCQLCIILLHLQIHLSCFLLHMMLYTVLALEGLVLTCPEKGIDIHTDFQDNETGMFCCPLELQQNITVIRTGNSQGELDLCQLDPVHAGVLTWLRRIVPA